MLRNHGESLNDESLLTLLVEVERITNSQSIACESIGDVNSIIPMEPSVTSNFKNKGSYATTRYIPERRHVV